MCWVSLQHCLVIVNGKWEIVNGLRPKYKALSSKTKGLRPFFLLRFWQRFYQVIKAQPDAPAVVIEGNRKHKSDGEKNY